MTWLLVFMFMLLVVLAMSVGVLMGRKPIAGSCGGIANLGIEKDECPICGGDTKKCEEAGEEVGKRAAVQTFDAARNR